MSYWIGPSVIIPVAFIAAIGVPPIYRAFS